MYGVGLPSLGGSSVRAAQLGIQGYFLRCKGGGQQAGIGLGWKAHGGWVAHRLELGDMGWGWERLIGGVSPPLSQVPGLKFPHKI